MGDVKAHLLRDFGSPILIRAKASDAFGAWQQVRFEYVAVLLEGLFEVSGHRSAVEAFAHVWDQELETKDPVRNRKAPEADGPDAMAFEPAIADGGMKAALLANTQSAFERGAFGSPTFFPGEEMYFGKGSLRDVEEEIADVKSRA